MAQPGPEGEGAARVSPLGPEQLRRVLERVARAPPPSVPRDAAPQQLEAICVKVTSGVTTGQERPMPPLAAIQPKTVRQGPQPLGRPGPPLCLLGGSAQAPVPQVFVQRSLPALQPVPARSGPAPRGQGATLAPLAASGPPPVVPTSSGLACVFISSVHTKHPEKLKKSLKVKTRSGRISRPPKHKARDYKFIKTEDLADGHPSDSDDYSELSVEEEEEQGARALFDSASCALRPKTFLCPTCEKSYIGKGGLARHLRLHPGHGQLELEVSLSQKVHGSLSPGCTEARTGGPASQELSTPAVPFEKGPEPALGAPQNGEPVEVEKALAPGPENGNHSAPLDSESQLAPTRRGFPEAPAVRSAAIPQSSRAAPLHGHPAGAVGSRALLKESLQQCGPEDLVELALPQLAQVVTVYEFLLMKVEKGYLAKPFFPAVYKEFEELHKMVKKMCQDYLSSGPHSQEPLEVTNTQVAESLGITEFLRKREMCPDRIPPKRPHAEDAEQGLTGVKRLRGEAPSTTAAEPLAARSGSRAGAEAPASEGLAPPCAGGSHRAGQADSDPRGRPQAFADSAPLCQDVGGPALYAQAGVPRGLSSAQVAALPEDRAPEHFTHANSGDSPRPGPCSTTPLDGRVEFLLAGRRGRAEAGALGVNGQQAAPRHARPSQAAASPLERFLPADFPLAHCGSSAGPQPGPEGALLTDEGLGSQAGDSNQFPCAVETHGGHRDLESMVATQEALALEMASGCPEVSQGPIFIQTSKGLILSHPGAMVSQEEDAVAVAHAEGSALQIAPPEGALQDAGGLLTLEAEPSQ